MGPPPTSPGVLPGGPKAKSDAKKARLLSLSQRTLDTDANNPPQQPPGKKARKEGDQSRPPHPPTIPEARSIYPTNSNRTPKGFPSKQLSSAHGSLASHAAHPQLPGKEIPRLQQGEDQVTQGGGNGRVGEPPYNCLDESIVTGPVARVLQQVPVAPQSTERGGRVAPQHHRTTNKASHGAGGVGSSGEGTLDMLVEVLLRTNPALRGSADARAAAGLRVQDKSILLDNPPAAQRTKPGARQAPGYAKQLTSKRRAPTPAILKQGDVRYTQLLPLHQIWQSYVFTQLNNALSLSVQPGQQQQPSQAQKRQKHDLSQAAQQQQQQQQLASKLTTNTTPSQPASNLQQAPPLCTSSAQKLLPVQVAAVRMQLSRCELHCSILQVVKCPNPRLVGCQGVVAQITARAVCVVDEGDHVHVVPKQGALFACDLSPFGIASTAALLEGTAL